MNNNLSPYPIFYRVADLMEILHIGRDKAYLLMRSKAFPSIQLGKTYVIAKEKFDRWAEDYSGREFHIIA